ncbi:hypothetical protein HPB51_018470 [Rhipicephalus microplus]|uniref:CUB domain-containing protein n=1 Tax=Rhipicephalus microplus TaxID=6941 RepID=A0A9J6DB55_RHIMP|nr:hypothetical protein HPB51_018470 [Rhipicephalus microplus]
MGLQHFRLHRKCSRRSRDLIPRPAVDISSLCTGERQYPLYRTIDGAVLTSEGESNLDCAITFQTDSILKRFVLRFETLSLDCHDHIAIFDGAHATGLSKVANLSCGSSPADVGEISIQGNFGTLKYTTDNESPQGSGFKLVITAYRNRFTDQMPDLKCQDFQCNNTLCISSNLTCDGVNHCGDNSDETSHASCSH